MATKEVNKGSSLPPYPEMICASLDALKQKEGLSKAAISKYIESIYGDLPAGHTNVLTQYLIKMKASGQLVMLKNNYMKPEPNSPPKRGRGRPPKAKLALPSKTARPRGRPRKNPNAPPMPNAKSDGISGVAAVSKAGKPRGRPRKV